MQIVRSTKYDTQEKIIQRVLKINASTKSLVERLCDLKIHAVSDHTMLFPPACWALVPCVALVLTSLVSILSASRPAIELPRGPVRLILLRFLRSAPTGKWNSLLPPWLVAPRKRSVLFVLWTAMANLMRYHRARSRSLPQAYSGTKYKSMILLDRSPSVSFRASKVLGPISRCRIADILPHMKLASRASRPGLTVGFLCILCNVLCTAQRFHIEGDEQTC